MIFLSKRSGGTKFAREKSSLRAYGNLFLIAKSKENCISDLFERISLDRRFALLCFAVQSPMII